MTLFNAAEMSPRKCITTPAGPIEFGSEQVKKLLASLIMSLGAMCSLAATQVVLTPANVIGSSGGFDARFAADNILDQQTGSINDTFGSTYWLNPDNTGANSIFITVDLGANYVISDLVLFNTHNANYFDRGTGAFTILGGNSVVNLGGGNFALSGSTTALVSSVLLPSATTVPTSQSFAVASSGSYRYLSFVPTSASALNALTSPTAYGLNELRVFATPVPEPSSWLMFFCGAMLLLQISRRRAGIARA